MNIKIRKKLTAIIRSIGLYKIIKSGYNIAILLTKNIMEHVLTHNTIFVYHRIARVSDDPHELCVSPYNFKKQLAYLKDNFNVVPLSEITNNLMIRKIKKKTVAITFDDGYADNLYVALPILEELGVPATVFIATGNMNSQKNFYWDQMTAPKDRGRPMTVDEIIKLGNHPLIQIGAHTVHHQKLSRVSQKTQKQEITESKILLEKILGRKIHGFAYPFGSSDSFSKETIEEVKRAGFLFACANTQQKVFFFSNIFAISRILIRDWDINTLKRKLNLH